MAFDPLAQRTVLFREAKKIKTLKVLKDKPKIWNFPEEPVYPTDFRVPENEGVPKNAEQ